MRDEKRLVYSSIEEALSSLNAQDKGRYFICTCPECQQDEAFIYKNNLSFIQCNRENQCGERMILHFKEKSSIEQIEKNIKKQEKPLYYIMTNEQIRALKRLSKLLKHMQIRHIPTLDFGYRDLSRDTLRPFVVDLLNPEYVAKMFTIAEPLFLKKYQNNEWLCKRNLIFPIYGEDGLVERILLRSSIDKNIQPKEIQLIVNPSKKTRDFFIDLPINTDTIVISEAILDALSFREIDRKVGIIGLTGVNRTKQLCDYILQNKQKLKGKRIILALDHDTAGDRATKKLAEVLKECKIQYCNFNYPDGVKDPNEYLTKDRPEFEKAYNRALQRFTNRNQQKENLTR